MNEVDAVANAECGEPVVRPRGTGDLFQVRRGARRVALAGCMSLGMTALHDLGGPHAVLEQLVRTTDAEGQIGAKFIELARMPASARPGAPTPSGDDVEPAPMMATEGDTIPADWDLS